MKLREAKQKIAEALDADVSEIGKYTFNDIYYALLKNCYSLKDTAVIMNVYMKVSYNEVIFKDFCEHSCEAHECEYCYKLHGIRIILD